MLYIFFRFCFRIIFKIFFRLEAKGIKNIPDKGAVILCSNHISLWDPPVVGTPLERKVHFMAKAELFKVPVLGQIIKRIGAFPVKRGGVSKESIKSTLLLLRNGEVLGIFPEGSRKNKEGAGKKGAASFALKSNAVVVPVAIIGKYKLFQKMKVVYGKPVDLDSIKTEESAERINQATELIMSSIQELKQSHRY